MAVQWRILDLKKYDYSEKTCGICLSNEDKTAIVSHELNPEKITHIFHANCIKRWILESNQATCPNRCIQKIESNALFGKLYNLKRISDNSRAVQCAIVALSSTIVAVIAEMAANRSISYARMAPIITPLIHSWLGDSPRGRNVVFDAILQGSYVTLAYAAVYSFDPNDLSFFGCMATAMSRIIFITGIFAVMARMSPRVESMAQRAIRQAEGL